MDPTQWTDPRYQYAQRLVEQSCRLSRKLQESFAGESFTKGDYSPVTLADLSVQALVGVALNREFPGDSVLGEETRGSFVGQEELLARVHQVVNEHFECTTDEILAAFDGSRDSTNQWVLDPIDGTKGFLRGDQFAIALAFLESDQVLFGLLGCPRLGLSGSQAGSGVIAAAYRARGAWQVECEQADWHRLQVSCPRDIAETRLLRSYEAAHTNESEIEDLIGRLGISAFPVALDSQAKYVLLARGDAEAVVRLLSSDKPLYKEKIWDQAAGSVIVQEAGGVITDLKGLPLDFGCGRTLANNTGILATAGIDHNQFLVALS